MVPGRLDVAYAVVQEGARPAEVIVVGFPRFVGYDVSCGQATDITLAEAQA